MAIIKGTNYLPQKDDDFFNFQGNLVNEVVTNTAWGIMPAAVTALVARRASYEPLYTKSQNKGNRTQADVLAHRQMRELYEKEIRAFVKTWLMFNPMVMDQDRRRMRLTVRDVEPTPRGKITSFPIIGLIAVGGGSIEVRARVTTDQTRSSMHSLADAVEVRYTLVPKGEMPPDDPESCPKNQVSKKARFSIACGVKNAGDTFYGFFRWVNLTNPQNNSDWTTKPEGVVIA
ncbi:MAG: hypothetical protein HY811_00725 [Planctomycetes bacterium]|nr:hypothetical protein [Planctomycetota bacterium]